MELRALSDSPILVPPAGEAPAPLRALGRPLTHASDNAGMTAPQLREAVAAANSAAENLPPESQPSVRFVLDDDFDRPIVRVVDQATQEVIRQIPSEEMLEIAKSLKQNQDLPRGLVVRTRA